MLSKGCLFTDVVNYRASITGSVTSEPKVQERGEIRRGNRRRGSHAVHGENMSAAQVDGEQPRFPLNGACSVFVRNINCTHTTFCLLWSRHAFYYMTFSCVLFQLYEIFLL